MDKENVVCTHLLSLSAVKNEIISFARKWMELEVFMSSERNQTQ
jgi:hypothetical protein